MDEHFIRHKSYFDYIEKNLDNPDKVIIIIILFFLPLWIFQQSTHRSPALKIVPLNTMIYEIVLLYAINFPLNIYIIWSK